MLFTIYSPRILLSVLVLCCSVSVGMANAHEKEHEHAENTIRIFDAKGDRILVDIGEVFLDFKNNMLTDTTGHQYLLEGFMFKRDDSEATSAYACVAKYKIVDLEGKEVSALDLSDEEIEQCYLMRITDDNLNVVEPKERISPKN